MICKNKKKNIFHARLQNFKHVIKKKKKKKIIKLWLKKADMVKMNGNLKSRIISFHFGIYGNLI